MSQELGTLVLELRAEVAGFKKSLADAKGSVEQFHGDMRRATMESRGAIVLLGEEIGVRLPRHLVTFLNTLPGVSTAMAAAFSGVAVAGLGLILIETGKKAYEFFERTGKAGENIQKGFDGLHEGAQKANDALAVTNDRLEIQIAKLEGRHTNALKLALDEARLSADDLADAMEAALKRASELLDKNKVGLLGAMLHGSMTTGSDKDLVGGVLAQVDKVLRENERRLHAAGPDDDVAALQAHNNAAAQEKLAWALGKVNTELGKRQSHILEGGAWEPRDLSANVAILQGAKDFLLNQQASLNESLRHGDDEAKRDRLTAAKEAGEAAKKAAAERLEQFKESLDAMKHQHGVDLQEEIAFWQSKITAFQTGSKQLLQVQDELDKLTKERNEKQLKSNVELSAWPGVVTGSFAAQIGKQGGGTMSDQIVRTAKVQQDYADAVDKAALAGIRQNAELAAGNVGWQQWTGRISAAKAIEEEMTIATEAWQQQAAILDGQLASAEGWAEFNPQSEEAAKRVEALRAELQKLDAEYSKTMGTLAGEKSGTTLTGAFYPLMRSGQDAAIHLKQTFAQVVDEINANLAKLMTGQKVNWGQMFQGVAAQVGKIGLEKLESSALGAIFPGLGSKPDGSLGNPLNVKVVGGLAPAVFPGSVAAAAAASASLPG